MPIPTDDERIGALIAERYKLEEILGRGGMGVVYGGTHTWTGRGVAVKVLKPDYAADPESVRRFLQEARSAAAIDHPNVIDVLDMGAEDDGTVFMVLERLEGETLGQRLDARGRLDAAEALDTMLPVLDGLRSAHAAHVLHRDIKPDNIFISTDGAGRVVPKLLDFGMSKVLGAALGTTHSGALLGTPYYMAPEQAEGAASIGPAADVWAAGAVLYQALVGKRPFEGTSHPAILLKIARGDFTPIATAAPHVPPRVAAVVERALALDLDERWPDVETFARALRAAAEQDHVLISTDLFIGEPMPGLDPISAPSSSPHRTPQWLFGAVAIAASGLGVGLLIASATSRGDRPAAVARAADVEVEAPTHDAPPELPPPTAEPARATTEAPIEPTAVMLRSEPDGAEVRVGGATRCNTPCEIDTGDAVRAEVLRRGYEPHVIELASGQSGELRVELTRRAGVRRSGSTTSPHPPAVPALPETPF
ncbi:MAG: serine/threonine-protein kinase [Sandaracinaceae bacterium]